MTKIDAVPLAPGETLLWTGRPDRRAFTARVFRTRWLLALSVAIAALRGSWIWMDSQDMAAAVVVGAATLLMGLAAVGLFALLGAWMARTTRYALTDRRLSFAFGAALPKTMDIPLHVIEAAALKTLAGGAGDVAVKPRARVPFSYLLLWPHARPWAFARPEPMLRAVPDAAAFAETLAGALRNAVDAKDAAPVRVVSMDETKAEPAHDPELPSPKFVRAAAFGGLALIAVTFVGVGLVQMGEIAPVGPDRSSPPQVLREIVFVDLRDDWVALNDASTGETITRLRPNSDGVLRNARRAFAYARRGAPSDAPYQIALWSDDRLTISDLATDTHVPLDAYGPTSTGPLAVLATLKP